MYDFRLDLSLGDKTPEALRHFGPPTGGICRTFNNGVNTLTPMPEEITRPLQAPADLEIESGGGGEP